MLYFTDFIEALLLHLLVNLFKQVEMLGSVSLAFLKLREVLNDSLHVFNRFELSLALLVLEELLNKVVDFFSHFTIVTEHLSHEELIVV